MTMNTSASPMLWNFEEPLSGESDSLGTTSSEPSSEPNDPLSMILASMSSRPIGVAAGDSGILSDGASLHQSIVLGNLGDGGIALAVAPPDTPPIREQMVKCPMCLESFRQPKVLACFHSFCKNCLERQLEESLTNAGADSGSVSNRVVCPLCGVDTFLSAQLGIEGLLSDYGLENAVNRVAAAAAAVVATEKHALTVVEEKELIFGSPSSTSSSPPLGRMSLSAVAAASEGDAVAAAATKVHAGCGGCKSGEVASAYCGSCSHYLCPNCSMAHRYMHCFEGHDVKELVAVVDSSSADSGNDSETSKTKRPSLTSTCTTTTTTTAKCLEHRSQPLRFFCLTCNLAICEECTASEHTSPTHQVESIDNVAEKQIALMEALIMEARNKQSELHEIFRLIDSSQHRLNASFQQAQSSIDEASQCLVEMIAEGRKVLLRELEANFGYKQLQLTLIDKEVQRMTKKMSQTITFTQRLLKYSSPTEVMVFKPLLDSRLQGFLNFNADGNNLLHTPCEVEVRPLAIGAARQAIYTLMNSLRSDSWQQQVPMNNGMNGNQQQQQQMMQQQQQLFAHSHPQPSYGYQQRSTPPVGIPFAQHPHPHPHMSQGMLYSVAVDTPGDAFNVGSPNQHHHQFVGQKSAAQMIHQHQHLGNQLFGGNAYAIGSSAPVGGGGLLSNEMLIDQSGGGGNSIFNQYEKWSSGMDPSSLGALSLTDPDALNDLSILSSSVDNKLRANPNANNSVSNTINGCGNGQYPPRSQIKRIKMSYHCKTGEFGVMEGQFTEPSGVAVNAQNDIIVADTNNHRIQVFDKEGRFKFQFGECGKRDGQLLYPNRVAVNKTTGDFIVTERSPTHQIQIYNQYGQFLRKFGANILQHPRGVCVDHQGRIVVVECKVMRVIIFSTHGDILQKFSCSRYLEFPNAVCTTDKEEILISDNRAHCVKVFNYEGQYLRQIGGEGITNYPIGVGITKEGEVMVADNHSSFNITLFGQDGTLLSALESKVKHAQCFDVALMEDGSVVVASKDYRLYLYRYRYDQQEPQCQPQSYPPYIGM